MRRRRTGKRARSRPGEEIFLGLLLRLIPEIQGGDGQKTAETLALFLRLPLATRIEMTAQQHTTAQEG